ncbi:MAG TPA: hypothetical protein VMN81_03860 [Vicinamibacterales bacterium]|nr:hypothetical protein [Vicinamibacterales bacterium]
MRGIFDRGAFAPAGYRGYGTRDRVLVMRAFPGRVLAVYIRNVSASAARSTAVKKLGEEVRAEGATLILADDTRADEGKTGDNV